MVPCLRPLYVSLSVLSILLSGCVTPGDPQTTAEGPAQSTAADVVFPWSLTDCAFAVAFVPADPAAVAAHIPSGFRLESDALGIEVFRCASGAGLNGSVDDIVYGSYFAAVSPPDDLALEGVDQYYYKWWVLVPDEERRDAFAALGMPVLDGTGSINADPLALGPVHGATMDVASIGAHTFRFVAPEQEAGDGGGDEWFAEFTPLADGGHAVWRSLYTVARAGGGPGVVEVPAGSMAAEILGGTVARANINTGVWSFHDGDVTFPAPTDGADGADAGHAGHQEHADDADHA